MNKLSILATGIFSAALLSGQALAGNPAAGKEKAKACAACHGADGGTPITPDIPKLAGQHADYLIKSLQGYKSGVRKNPVMAPMSTNLSLRDIEDLAAYFASQQGLVTFR